MIRFIIESYSSKTTANGYRKHCAVITSTLTGKQLAIKDCAGSNGAYHVLRAMLPELEYRLIYESNHDNIPLREFSQLPANKNGIYQHALNSSMFEDLEKVQP